MMVNQIVLSIASGIKLFLYIHLVVSPVIEIHLSSFALIYVKIIALKDRLQELSRRLWVNVVLQFEYFELVLNFHGWRHWNSLLCWDWYMWEIWVDIAWWYHWCLFTTDLLCFWGFIELKLWSAGWTNEVSILRRNWFRNLTLEHSILWQYAFTFKHAIWTL